MDYSHNPILIYTIGILGILVSVVFLVMVFFLFKKPKHIDDPNPPTGE